MMHYLLRILAMTTSCPTNVSDVKSVTIMKVTQRPYVSVSSLNEQIFSAWLAVLLTGKLKSQKSESSIETPPPESHKKHLCSTQMLTLLSRTEIIHHSCLTFREVSLTLFTVYLMCVCSSFVDNVMHDFQSLMLHYQLLWVNVMPLLQSQYPFD